MRYIYSAAVVERNRSGDPIRMIGINRDVTDQMMYDEYLQNMNAVLEQRVAERTAALQATAAELARANAGKDAFMAAISHELRTPLTGILSMAEILEVQTAGALTPHQARCVDVIRSSGERLLGLVNDVLLYTSLIAGRVTAQFAPCQLNDLCIVAVRAVMEKAARKNQTPSLEVEPGIPPVITDAELLTKALAMLLDNAIKFTASGGALGIEAGCVPGANAVRIVVWDAGIGIAEEQLPYLFSPFTQIDQSLARRFEGTGIGLASIRKLVELLGGTVTVESQAGSGSRFTVTLPA